MSNRQLQLQPWMLFALPAGIAVPITVGILLGGPLVGFVVAVLLAVVIVVVAVRMGSDRRGQGTARTSGVARQLCASSCLWLSRSWEPFLPPWPMARCASSAGA